jgi:flagellar protein FliS
MNPKAAQNYLRTKVMTATPEQLQLLLFDGAIRFGEQARVALQQKKYEQSYQLLTRTQAIVNQLICALNPKVLPDLCEKLKGLYVYAYKKLVDANLNHRIEHLDEALNVLKYQRDTWATLMQALGKQRAAAAAKQIEFPGPSERMEATLSMKG